MSHTVAIPQCATRCPLVTALVVEIARLRGTTEQVQRLTHGLPGEDHPPDPDLISRELRAPAHHPV